MGKVIFGTGLMICGTLAGLTHTLVTVLSGIGIDQGVFISRRATLMDYGIVIFIAGVILSVWGLKEQDKNGMKITVFGTGLIICGALLEFGYFILWDVAGWVWTIVLWDNAATQDWFPIPEYYRFFAYAFIFGGVALNIWGLVRSRKKGDLVV